MGRQWSSGRAAAIAVTLLLLFSFCHSKFLSGVAPRDFQRGDELQVKMDTLSSAKTQLPYDFYLLKYCKPIDHEIEENPGEDLPSDDEIGENPGEELPSDSSTENSAYMFRMREDQSCKVACVSHLDAQSAKDFKDKIDDEYRANMILGDLPVAELRERISTSRYGTTSTKYEYGFRIGFKRNSSMSNEDKYFIHNHLSFRVMIHRDAETDSSRIVGFEVSPISLKHEYKGRDEQNNPIVPTCEQHTENLIQAITIPQEVDKGKQIVFTYDVTFKERNIKWASRWDTYLLVNDADGKHWSSLRKSLLNGLLFSFAGAMLVRKFLQRDVAKYKTKLGYKWKHLQGDVFRPPSNHGLLCVYVGTGVQILGTTLVTMILALSGFLSPSNLGEAMTHLLPLCAAISGSLAGYLSARLYKMFKGRKWKRQALKTALMFPVILISVLFVLNALLREKKSSGAVPIGTMFQQACLCLVLFVLYVFSGSDACSLRRLLRS